MMMMEKTALIAWLRSLGESVEKIEDVSDSQLERVCPKEFWDRIGALKLRRSNFELLKLILGFAVQCDAKAFYINKIMELPESEQAILMHVLEDDGSRRLEIENSELRTENATLKDEIGNLKSEIETLKSLPGEEENEALARLDQVTATLEGTKFDLMESRSELEFANVRNQNLSEKLKDTRDKFQAEKVKFMDEIDVLKSQTEDYEKMKIQILKLEKKSEENARLRSEIKKLDAQNSKHLKDILKFKAERRAAAAGVKSAPTTPPSSSSRILKGDSRLELETAKAELAACREALEEAREARRFFEDERRKPPTRRVLIQEEEERGVFEESPGDLRAKIAALTTPSLDGIQAKYTVLVHTYKSQLKEKQDKIETLEAKLANDRSLHKREESLLLSAIYNLGSTIIDANFAAATAAASSGLPAEPISSIR